MNSLETIIRLSIALLLGGAIGLERSYNGRPAGFRTHTLVCLSSSLLMLIPIYESLWFNARGSVDPTRMAQGIMTGIGFVGAGTIVKDGLTVRGLTTAASIWITAAVGILVGTGLYLPAVIATALTLGVLSLFRWIEKQVPYKTYARLEIRFSGSPEAEEALRAAVAAHEFKISSISYEVLPNSIEYQLTLVYPKGKHKRDLLRALHALENVERIALTPASN